MPPFQQPQMLDPSTNIHKPPKPTSLPLGLPPNNPHQPPPTHRTHSDTLSTGGPTPSLLTPNTRSEAEAAFASNTALQTDSAAPTTPGIEAEKLARLVAQDGDIGDVEAGRRPVPQRRTTNNYIDAMVASAGGPETGGTAGNTEEESKSPAPASVPTAGGEGKAESAASGVASDIVGTGEKMPKAFTRQQSWNQQDLKREWHLKQKLMEKGDDVGYDSATEQSVSGVRAD